MDDKITIDKETLKAIASDSRLNILKSLDKKKKTLSDLSTELKLSNPTIKEHLDILSSANLVRKEVSLRKWKYYSLTFKGKQLLKPNETRLFLALVLTTVGTTIFGLFLLLKSMTIGGLSKTTRMAYDSASTEAIESMASSPILQKDLIMTAAVESPTFISKISFNNVILSLLIVLIIVLFIFYIKEKSK
jgi:DNA-binding transcriptional ArsR family regulator